MILFREGARETEKTETNRQQETEKKPGGLNSLHC